MNDNTKAIYDQIKHLCPFDCTNGLEISCSDIKDCLINKIATALDALGYRKQSDTVKEFAEKVTDIVFPETMKYINTDIGKGMAKVIVEINKLAEEFGGEDNDGQR